MGSGEEKEEERFLVEAIHSWVWSGFYSRSEVLALLDDELANLESVDESAMRSLVDRELDEKARQEQHWPETTDCDRLDLAFAGLRAVRIIAIHNAGYTMSQGHNEVGQVHAQKPHGTFRGYCFYHGQDVAGAVRGHGLYLAYGDMQDTDAGKAAVAQMIIKSLTDHGLAVAWSGDVKERIHLPAIGWQRRHR